MWKSKSLLWLAVLLSLSVGVSAQNPNPVSIFGIGTGTVVGTTIPISGTVTITDGAGAVNVIVDSGTITAVTAITNALPAGTNNIGDVDVLTFPDNEPFNVAQINGVTVLMGAGNTGTGAQRVIEATDSQLSAGVGATGDAAATVGSTGSAAAKLRLVTTQLDAIQTAVQLLDNNQTGDTVLYRTSAGSTEDEHEVKATAGVLYSIAVTNTAATVSYWKCSNLTAANTTPGTSAVYLGLAIPGATTGAGFTHTFGPNGAAFSTALTCYLVKGAADTDVAEVGANEIKINYSFK